MRCAPIFATAALALAVAACGEDDEAGQRAQATPTPAATSTAAAGDAQRYCALTGELDAAGERFFAGLGRDASPAQFQAAERRFVQRFSGKLAELERAAPQEIAADARTLLAAQRDRAGLPTSERVTQAKASAAEERLRAYERRNCRG
jgi:hypothetical protein